MNYTLICNIFSCVFVEIVVTDTKQILYNSLAKLSYTLFLMISFQRTNNITFTRNYKAISIETNLLVICPSLSLHNDLNEIMVFLSQFTDLIVKFYYTICNFILHAIYICIIIYIACKNNNNYKNSNCEMKFFLCVIRYIYICIILYQEFFFY